MYLFGVGTGNDVAVTDSVAMIRAATNVAIHETHHYYRLEVEDIIRGMGAYSSTLAVFVCHGSPTALIDVARDPFLTSLNHQLFLEKVVFAHAFSSALHLGRDIVISAFIYFGFDAPISAPVGPSSLCYGGSKQIYARILSFLSMLDVSDVAVLPARCRAMLDELRADAISLQSAYDTADGSQLDAEELIFINQFTKDVAIWVQGSETSLKANGAPDRCNLW